MHATPSNYIKFQAGVVVISGLWGLGKSTLAFPSPCGCQIEGLYADTWIS